MNTTENTQKSSEKNVESPWAAICHLSALVGFAVPFGNILGPVVVWLLKKDESQAVMQAGKEAINFQITASILLLGLWLLSMSLTAFSAPFPLIVSVIATSLAGYVPLVFAGIKAYKVYHGQSFSYPSVFSFIK